MAVETLSHEIIKEIDKFMQKVDLMKKFSHPNIVSLLGQPVVFLGHIFFCVVYMCTCMGYLARSDATQDLPCIHRGTPVFFLAGRGGPKLLPLSHLRHDICICT